jgi:hypothetical protein
MVMLSGSTLNSFSAFVFWRKAVFPAIFAFFIFISSAYAATYYVATNGSDSGSGSEGAPFRTIAYAVKKMVAGDTTYVRGGTYNEKLIMFSKSGTASAPIKLLNAPGETPVINFGVNASNRLVHRIELNAPGAEATIGWITIEGFELGYGYDGIKFYNAHDITIRRNWIHHAIGQGILGTGKNILIDRNVISHNGDSKLDHGMYITGSNYVITNNLIYANGSYGLQVAGYPWDMSEYGGGGRPFSGHGGRPDPSYAGASGWLIANNTFAYNGSSGIVLWQRDTVNNRIINNIFYENSVNARSGSSPQGINFYGTSGGNTVDNNLFYASGAGGAAAMGGKEGWQNKYTGSGNIINTANPNFEGASATISGVPNFKLNPGSPAIDKGQSLSQVTWDHAGGKRPFGAAFDIGAYEFGSPPDSGSPPPNPTGGEYGSPGAPVLLGPNGEVCPTGYN